MSEPLIPPPTEDDAVRFELLSLERIYASTAPGKWTNETFNAVIRRCHAAEQRAEKAEEFAAEMSAQFSDAESALAALQAKYDEIERERDGIKATLEVLNAAGTYIVRHRAVPIEEEPR